MARCPAQSTIGKTTNRVNREPKTVHCELDEGHEGAHVAHSVGHEYRWYGEARKSEDNTNYRYGLRPGWQMNT